MINVGLQSEYVLNFFGTLITNTFFTSLFITIPLGAIGLLFYFNRNKKKGFLYKVLRVLIFELLKIADAVTQDRSLSKKVLPLILTFFIFILISNLSTVLPGLLGSFFVDTSIGELPIFRSPNSDLTTTVALALFAVGSIQYFSIQTLGPRQYINRFFNLSGPIKFILGFFEMISEAIKILSFSFRLFGNIFAGEVLLLVVTFLIPYIIPLPFMILEVFVGIIQAFIFSVLTLTFIRVSTIRHIRSRA